MDKENFKTGIIILLLFVVAILGIGSISKPPQREEDSSLQDTIFLSQWRHEKQVRLALDTEYQKNLSSLKKENNALREKVKKEKVSLVQSRSKIESLLIALSQNYSGDSIQIIAQDSISLVDSLVVAIQEENQACDSAIVSLEQIVANRDSAIVFQGKVEENIRQEKQDQELANLVLNNQVKVALKKQKRLLVQKKLLSASLFILTGISTTLLAIQSRK